MPVMFLNWSQFSVRVEHRRLRPRSVIGQFHSGEKVGQAVLQPGQFA
jgi:hypothetical protein